ncbi:MAG: TonB-dependent receptor [Rhodocyclaceae bacterium]|nr:TonB-dependent receptor [Rhodocyclaceae bacterium]
MAAVAAMSGAVVDMSFAAEEGPLYPEADSPTIVVTGSRIPHPSFDLPASVTTLTSTQIRDGRWQVNSSESLQRIPGLYAQNRQTFAQDLQFSSRGFGARAQFGVRGVRIIADDIPATMPDGQGQTGSFALSSAQRIEVLRGPFSVLYGNHSGGVVQIFTEDGPPRPTTAFTQAMGSNAATRTGLTMGGQSDSLNYRLDLSRFSTDGYRIHSAAERTQFNGKLRIELSEDSQLTWVASHLEQPNNLDPLGLTAAQVQSNRRQAAAVAMAANTRRSLGNSQSGWVYERKLGDEDSLRLVGYIGDRRNEQFLPVPFNAAMFIRGSGGDSVIAREFGGTGLRWTHRQGDLTVTSGFEWERMKDARTGYENDGRRRGALRRDEDNIATATGAYSQAEWQASDRWALFGGIRINSVEFVVKDHYVKPQINLDDSGAKQYSATTPVAGALFRISPTLNLYATMARGFETPTFVEMAYRPDGQPGINFDLKSSRSRNFEIGLKALVDRRVRIDMALFDIDTRGEVVISSNVAGRATYANAAETRRRGVEIGIDTTFTRNLSGSLAYSYLAARYAGSFESCLATAATPCSRQYVPDGRRLPGVPSGSLFAELVWRQPSTGLTMAVDGRYASKVYVDDFNSQAAPAYALAGWRMGIEQQVGPLRLTEFLYVDNIFDHHYIGAVYVGEGNGRYYAPAPGRTWMAGVSLAFHY